VFDRLKSAIDSLDSDIPCHNWRGRVARVVWWVDATLYFRYASYERLSDAWFEWTRSIKA